MEERVVGTEVVARRQQSDLPAFVVAAPLLSPAFKGIGPQNFVSNARCDSDPGRNLGELLQEPEHDFSLTAGHLTGLAVWRRQFSAVDWRSTEGWGGAATEGAPPLDFCWNIGSEWFNQLKKETHDVDVVAPVVE